MFLKRHRIKISFYLEHKDSRRGRVLTIQVKGRKEDFERWTIAKQAGHWKTKLPTCLQWTNAPAIRIAANLLFLLLSFSSSSLKTLKGFPVPLFVMPKPEGLLDRGSCIHILPTFSLLLFVLNKWRQYIHERSKILRKKVSFSKFYVNTTGNFLAFEVNTWHLHNT